jgi:hypothetical protein
MELADRAGLEPGPKTYLLRKPSGAGRGLLD